MTSKKKSKELDFLEKTPTGISGLDEITFGGLPKGRPTLVAGGAGSGKTLMSMEFLIRGVLDYNEPGVFMAFEETAEELTKNVSSLGFDLNDLVARKKVNIDYVYIERSEIEETGEYDLEALFIRLGQAIDSIGAKRVVLDTVEALFSGLPNPSILRAELRRLFRWLKRKGVTAIITAERGEGTLTRFGLEEYVADAVIVLDHRVDDQISTRRLRIVKYRGSTHGTNEYPFLIDETGISILPITSIGLTHAASNRQISSGVGRLDEMLAKKGYYCGSSILVTGSAGTGKSSLAAHFARAICERKERCLYFAMEESPNQIMRNMLSIGIDLGAYVRKGLLRFHPSRPTLHGLEMHLLTMHKLIEEFKPTAVILDPATNFVSIGKTEEVRTLLIRMIDYLKSKQITSLMTSLTHGGEEAEISGSEISSLIDTWILLKDIEISGERNRIMYILKSRGMAHSNQIREFLLTDEGVRLSDVYLGPAGMLTGSAQEAQKAKEQAEASEAGRQAENRRRIIERRRKVLENRMLLLEAKLQDEQRELDKLDRQAVDREREAESARKAMAKKRGVKNRTSHGKTTKSTQGGK